ncbi:MAG: hypothetical protein IPL33_20850 [Sphingobacteriales bacterium]|nr:hypothetical protein [Sphingobacteriales bacterium]
MPSLLFLKVMMYLSLAPHFTQLDAQKFHLLRRVKPASLENLNFPCYFALNLVRSNFTCYGELNPLHLSLCYFALNLTQQFHLLRSTKPSLCYFALNLIFGNFTCYEALNHFT